MRSAKSRTRGRARKAKTFGSCAFGSARALRQKTVSTAAASAIMWRSCPSANCPYRDGAFIVR